MTMLLASMAELVTVILALPEVATLPVVLVMIEPAGELMVTPAGILEVC